MEQARARALLRKKELAQVQVLPKKGEQVLPQESILGLELECCWRSRPPGWMVQRLSMVLENKRLLECSMGWKLQRWKSLV